MLVWETTLTLPWKFAFAMTVRHSSAPTTPSAILPSSVETPSTTKPASRTPAPPQSNPPACPRAASTLPASIANRSNTAQRRPSRLYKHRHERAARHARDIGHALQRPVFAAHGARQRASVPIADRTGATTSDTIIHAEKFLAQVNINCYSLGCYVR